MAKTQQNFVCLQNNFFITLVFLINVQARLFFGGSISPLHTHFYLVPARLLGTTYILIRPTLPISRLHAYLALHVY